MFTKALYYPHIHLPDNAWLRRAILYWDQVNPIVPENLNARVEGDELFKLLRAEGLSEPIAPEAVVFREREEQLRNEFLGLVSGKGYLTRLGPRERREFSTAIYVDKVAYGLLNELERLGLVEGPDRHGWLRFEPTTGAMYMSCLAATLAQSYGLEPLTDRRRWQDDLLRSQLQESDREQVFGSFVLEELIPAPGGDVGIAEIVTFRREHEEELLRFRRALRGLFESLRDASDEVEAARKLDEVRDDVREQSLAVQRKLGESRIEARASSLEVSWAAAGSLAAVVNLPIGLAVAGIGAMIKLGRQHLNGRIRESSILAENPYTYVYRIERELTEE